MTPTQRAAMEQAIEALETADRRDGFYSWRPEIDALRAALAEPAPVQEPVWLPMDAAPKDGTHVFLLVEFEDHAMEDATGPQLTIGSNTSENDGGPDEWQFAGWNWEHDCYTQGVGNPVGWLPMTVLQLKEHQDTETVPQTQEKSNDHKLVPLRPPESILAVVRKAYGNATAYDVGHVWHEIYTRLPDAAPVQEQQPAPASKPVLLQCLGCERVGTQEQLSASTDCDCWLHTQPAPVQETASHFKNACWLRTSFSIGRYLMSNAHGRWSGAEKALYHRELCKFYVAAVRGFDDEGLVDLCGEDFKAVHESTQQLTDRMDEVIGFPLKSMPDYDKLGPLFFDHFHALAMKALKATQQPAPPADVPMLTDEELVEHYCAIADGTEWAISGLIHAVPFARAIEQAVRQKAGLP